MSPPKLSPPPPKPLLYLFPLLSLVAFTSMHVFARRNGTTSYRALFSSPDATLINTSIPLQTPDTGSAPLNEYLSLMLNIFWVDLDPRNVVAHIQGSHFLGTLTGAWLIMLVEAHRLDGTGKGRGHWWVIRTYFIETLAELVGLGFLTPIWCALELSGERRKGPRRLRRRDAVSLPIAVALGHFVPTMMMILCEPDGVGWVSQQRWVLLRLFHPVWTYAIWGVLRLVVTAGDELVAVRGWYVSAIVVATVWHTIALGPIPMKYLARGWLNPAVEDQLDLWAIFVPAPFWSSIKISSFAQGVSYFLQWDELMTGVAIFVWSMYYYAQNGGMKDTFTSTAYLGFLLVTGGPVVAAAYMMQETDRMDEEQLNPALIENKKTL